MIEWIAAGFDPVAAPRQTLRGIQRAVTAAARGARRRLADTTIAVFMGARASADEARQFHSDLLAPDRRPLPPEAQARALDAFANSLGTISLAEYRARLRTPT